MRIVNVRNLDPEVWRRFGFVARARRTTVGRLLSAVLRDWLQRNAAPHGSRQQWAKATAGMFAHLQPQRSLSEELLADRRAEEAAESRV
ncbi:MAG TPA: hypothetical protein VK457_25940 [Chloroflexota bacterium]|nr:hypothetical protein [Chloroflexota bacterium]